MRIPMTNFEIYYVICTYVHEPQTVRHCMQIKHRLTNTHWAHIAQSTSQKSRTSKAGVINAIARAVRLNRWRALRARKVWSHILRRFVAPCTRRIAFIKALFGSHTDAWSVHVNTLCMRIQHLLTGPSRGELCLWNADKLRHIYNLPRACIWVKVPRASERVRSTLLYTKLLHLNSQIYAFVEFLPPNLPGPLRPCTRRKISKASRKNNKQHVVWLCGVLPMVIDCARTRKRLPPLCIGFINGAAA